ncbi:RDD family protein [Streptomyces sp. NPDC054794]
MSAPTPAPGDDRPREGYYPDPSIPGYVRYWNGAAWVPGTSRPAPTDGEPLAPPPGRLPAAPVVEETGPHFFDEDPQPASPGQQPASAWAADRSRQAGFGGEQDRRVSWGADPRIPADLPSHPDGHAHRTDGTATIPPADPTDVPSDGTFVFRRPVPGAGSGAAGVPGQGAAGAAGGPVQGPVGVGTPGTAAGTAGVGGAGSGGGGAGNAGRPGFGAGKAAARAAAAQAQSEAQAAPGQAQSGMPGQVAGGVPQAGQPSGAASPMSPAAPSVPQQSAAVPPPQSGAGAPMQAGSGAPAQAGSATPVTSGSGGGQSSWAQQVHRLAGAGDEQPVAPWKPPVEDPFQAMARRQAAARPAGLGKRLLARLIDTLVVGGVTAAAALPFAGRTIDHVQEKIDAAELSGRTVTVWLLDGTTGAYLGIVLAVLLVTGLLYEVLPTAKWGRTLGKRLCGVAVRDIEGHEPPTFGLSLRRWFVYTVPGLLGIGVVGILWCLFDRPWHQCWHDKAAHTFVAG